MEASRRLQGLTPHPRDLVLKTNMPERDPSMGPNYRESGPPIGNLCQHHQKERRDHRQIVRQKGKA
jgi:hypothetical protein